MGKTIKKILCTLLVVVMCLTCMPFEVVYGQQVDCVSSLSTDTSSTITFKYVNRGWNEIAPIIIYGGSANEIITTGAKPNQYWHGIVIEYDWIRNCYYVAEKYDGASETTAATVCNLEAETSKGFVIFIWMADSNYDNTQETTGSIAENVAVGDYVTVSKHPTTIASGYNASGYGTVSFSKEYIEAPDYEIKNGDVIEFGSYPQSEITDTNLLANLNSIDLEWISYGYNNTDMQYADVYLGDKKYRAVKFSRYRGKSNGYEINTVYWFKYEALKWIVLDPNEGLVLCTTIIDSQPYNETIYGDNPYYKDSNKTIFVDDYEYSSIRGWLNNEFYNTAFTSEQMRNIKTSHLSDLELNDKIFCISEDEATNTEYGFSSGYSTYCDLRRTVGTDYAKVQGLYVATASQIIYKGSSHWWLRVPANGKKAIYTVYDGGQIGAIYATSSVWQGTRPAMTLNLNNLQNNDDYKINLYSSMPAMTIGKNKTVNCIAELQNNGETVYDDFEYSVVVSDPDVIEVKNLAEHSEGLFFEVSSKNEGVARITLTETLSGAVYSTQIEVKDHVMTFNSSAMPVYRDFIEYYNGYVDGMYIDDYSCSDSEDKNYCNMSFNVYNATDTIGAVEVYDSNGKLTNIYPIDRHNGTKVTGFGDIIWKWGVLLFDDLFNGELLTFKQDSYTTKTPIEDIEVQKGGYVKITNSIINSDSVAALNMVGYIINAVCLYKGVVGSVEDAVTLYKNINKSLITKIIGGDLNKFSDKMIDTYADIAGKDISIEAFNDVATTLINGGTSLLTQSGFNLAKIAVESAKSLGIDFAEDAFTKYLGGYGLLMEALFAWDEVMDLVSWTIDLTNYYENAFEIFVDTADSKLCNNGVTISKENGMTELSNNNFVMRSILITEDEDISNSSKEFLEDIADNYIVRNIYLEKDGVIVQPDETVIVSIPIPEDYDASKCVVYWLKDDGTTELMQTTVFGGYIHFQTDHFSYYALVELHEHSYEIADSAEATCTEIGYKKYVCSCEDEYTEVTEPTGHSYNSVVTAPTCTDKGYTSYSCICGYGYKDNYKNALGHSYEKNITSPTCTSNGQITYTCTCGDTYTETLESIGHAFNGSKCVNCGYDKADTCSCNCHKSGFIGFIWKILRFFFKLFRINKICDCGIAHY